MYSAIGEPNALRKGMMGLEMPFDQIVQNQQPPQPPQAAPQPPQQPPQGMGQPTALGQPQPPQTPPQAPQQQAQAQQPQKPELHQEPKEKTGKEYNGEIDINGKKVNVTDGVVDGSVEEPGKKVFVSADGKVVWDNTGKVLGSVNENGVFEKVTKEQIDELEKAGVVKRSTTSADASIQQGQTK